MTNSASHQIFRSLTLQLCLRLNLQFNNGWKELEWVAMNALIVFVFAGAAPRIRKASLVRNHQTPSDFITDMFRSQLLRYATITIQLVAQFIWMTSNVVAVKNAFNTAFNLDEDYPWMYFPKLLLSSSTPRPLPLL